MHDTEPLPAAPEAMTARQIRETLLLPALARAGWGQVPDSRVLEEVAVPAGTGVDGRADVLLLYRGRALALVEIVAAGRSIDEAVVRATALGRALGLRLAYLAGGISLHRLDLATGLRTPVDEFDGPQALWAQLFGDSVQAPKPMYRTLGPSARPPSPSPVPRQRARPPEPEAPTMPDEMLGGSAAAAPPEFIGEPAGAAAPEAAPPPTAEPVLLAASAPRQCAAGDGFTASLAAYVASARDAALQQLQQLGETGDRVISDLAPSADAHWAVGAPVSVRLAGDGFDVTPAEQAFHWSGRLNTVAFDVQVRADAPAAKAVLWCHVALAGVPMAAIPLRVAVVAATSAPVATAPTAGAPQQADAPAPHSVFASYSSKDAADVTQRLSTLVRWAPGLDIFQDCLDLQPNEAFKPQLAAQIGQRDAFLLFWSRNAAASPWVRWEYETASAAKGLQAIVPMPLEDPAIAPPPPGLADLHLRDRFLLARYGLQKIREEAVAAGR